MGGGKPETVDEDVSKGLVECRSGDTSVEARGIYIARESTACVSNEVERKPSPNACSPETKKVGRRGTPSVVGEICDYPDHSCLEAAGM